MYVVLIYDIPLEDGGARIQRNVFKICKKYLFHIQLSVFEGDISKVQLKQLKNELDKYIRKEKDSIIVFKSREKRWLEKEFYGKVDDITDNFL
ncbi:CRISPR-associated endonuclease Cas2 [Lachnobacterium bovis]|uniref:CRISPR-associated endoribonuclease Cas2 n=1 Tax=Lachnobacterium bovis TaxID=140626 RepID=A0A1H9S5U3_9FIRM|nr:CRISPR-associated endonuclease Cas2 [Lachnobacterium bovis]SER80402.1 CRISPR-associated protein Cas2 [Lachnobacterium bovis]